MKALLFDSNALLFTLYKSIRVGSDASRRISETRGGFISVVSIWELAIKYYMGRLSQSPGQILLGVERLGLTMMTLNPSHVVLLEGIDLPQKDPFDRMLVAQAQAEGLTFATSDKNILASKYDTLDITK